MRFILLDPENTAWYELINVIQDCDISKKCKLYPPFHLDKTIIGDYSYISRNSRVSLANIGKFCSIGMNFVCGNGIHPTNGISTSPFFYSVEKQNGFSISENNKIEERKLIKIGNDVFIGMNVTVLDGVQIGNGTIIGAGAVVSKDIPPYSIAVGSPEVIGYRFDNQIIEDLLNLKWWDKDENTFQLVENLFFEVEEFIREID